jgi:C1A family cysteine protease
MLKPKFRVSADPEDFRDLAYEAQGTSLRNQVDLRSWASPPENQDHLGSCIGNAVVGAYELLLKHQCPGDFVYLSRLFVYYNARLLEDIITEDAGAYVRDGIRAVAQYGICAESIWPYDINQFATRPSEASYTDAQQRLIKNYRRLDDLDDILDALNQNLPVVFGMKVYAGFEYITPHHYVLQVPDSTEQPIGGHAMVAVGYDLEKELLLVRNSFGINWGWSGYCQIPFDYVNAEFVDMWVFDLDLHLEHHK